MSRNKQEGRNRKGMLEREKIDLINRFDKGRAAAPPISIYLAVPTRSSNLIFCRLLPARASNLIGELFLSTACLISSFSNSRSNSCITKCSLVTGLIFRVFTTLVTAFVGLKAITSIECIESLQPARPQLIYHGLVVIANLRLSYFFVKSYHVSDI